jgi:hypothetical protein
VVCSDAPDAHRWQAAPFAACRTWPTPPTSVSRCLRLSSTRQQRQHSRQSAKPSRVTRVSRKLPGVALQSHAQRCSNDAMAQPRARDWTQGREASIRWGARPGAPGCRPSLGGQGLVAGTCSGLDRPPISSYLNFSRVLNGEVRHSTCQETCALPGAPPAHQSMYADKWLTNGTDLSCRSLCMAGSEEGRPACVCMCSGR